ncbi:AraC-type DNA-binding protein [Roseateles sp. YR242]|uniref:AraC family transcriptional regulator n=1 Tax=Roseateles sp. YR242 TaxID=1855305 RepID=UPI0008CBB19F|nr:AraC family transcriptional regulator [Roseateles sp. YR242]SEL49254.1 AraC-type DNA-binding protein [Roseateles sp. YR242]
MVAPTSLPLADELQALRAQMVDLTLRHVPGEGSHQSAISCLHLVRACSTTPKGPALYEPGVVIVLQGRKKVELGQETLFYDPLHFLLVSMTMLPRGQVVDATPEKPYLCIRVSCDTQTLADLMLEVGPMSSDATPQPQSGLNVAPVDAPLLGAGLRLMQLLDNPQDQRVLGPLLQREIFYRVLTGPLGPRLRSLAQQDSATRRLSRAIDELTRRFNEPLSIEQLAEVAHMSPSTLHQRFKQLTSFSPMQYQKQLRLQHARRLMLAEGLDAASAAHQVGYESASQFSREYRRLFGTPPRADIEQILRAS